MRSLIRYLLLFMPMLAFQACVEIPDYPIVPSISFNSVEFVDGTPNISYINMTLNYKDGDGDLGLNNADLQNPPFTEYIDSAGIQVLNPNSFNIFVYLFRKEGERYDSLKVNYRGTFPRLRDDERNGPIEGILQYRMESFSFFGGENSMAKLKVYIQDRKLNKSNVIETPPFQVIFR